MQDVVPRHAELECTCQKRQFSYRNAVFEILSELDTGLILEIKMVDLQHNQYFKV